MEQRHHWFACVFLRSILWDVGTENSKKLLALVSSGIVLCTNHWISVDG